MNVMKLEITCAFVEHYVFLWLCLVSNYVSAIELTSHCAITIIYSGSHSRLNGYIYHIYSDY